MIEHLGQPPWGAIALVSYVPDPLRSFLVELSRVLPGNDDPQPHITILPPRPLRQHVQIASLAIQATLDQFRGFTVELSKVRLFPETNFLYLDIGCGNKSIRGLHFALNSGDLAHAERFEFRPHLTLGGPFDQRDIEHARSKAEAVWVAREKLARNTPARVAIDDLVCLWLPPSSNWGAWQRLWSYRLGAGTRRPEQPVAAAAFTSQTY